MFKRKKCCGNSKLVSSRVYMPLSKVTVQVYLVAILIVIIDNDSNNFAQNRSNGTPL